MRQPEPSRSPIPSQSPSQSPSVGRRAVLGGAAATGAGALLGSVGAAEAAAHGARGIDQRVIDRITARVERGAVELRRSVHRHPELAGEERRTAALVARRLAAAGLTPVTGVGGHGVTALLEGRYPGRTIAYRADMDAVPPHGQLEPRARRREAAHVCGHDVHTAVGVGVAEVLARLRRRLHGRVLFVFQPAEEALTGARAMLDDGVLDVGHGVDEIYALHCGPVETGSLTVMPGLGLAGQDTFTIRLVGADARARAERLAGGVSALGTVRPPRSAAELERLIDWARQPDGPLSRFVYMQARADAGEDGTATVRGSYRTWPPERWRELRAEIRRLAAAEAADEPSFSEGKDPFPAMVCDPRLSELAGERFRRVLGPGGAVTLHGIFPPFNGEDFSLFLRRVPGAMFFLGIRPDGGDVWEAMPHSVTFTPDERAIATGIRTMAGLLADRAGRRC